MALLRRRPVGVLVGVGIALVMACGNPDKDEDDSQFREDVIWCEEAVARLQDCCGATFNPTRITCRHYYSKDTGCGQTSIEKIDPAFTLAESRCIQDTSCERIVQADMCNRAMAAGAARITSYSNSGAGTSGTSTSSTSGGSAATGPVCP